MQELKGFNLPREVSYQVKGFLNDAGYGNYLINGNLSNINTLLILMNHYLLKNNLRDNRQTYPDELLTKWFNLTEPFKHGDMIRLMSENTEKVTNFDKIVVNEIINKQNEAKQLVDTFRKQSTPRPVGQISTGSLPSVKQISPHVIKPIITPYIVGPVSVSEWVNSKKDIYVFGDIHTKKDQQCPFWGAKTIKFEKFLEQTFENNPNKIIDFYLEQRFISKEFERVNMASGHHLFDVAQYFDECFQVSKLQCKYKNVRFHYVDIRYIPNTILFDAGSLERLYIYHPTFSQIKYDWYSLRSKLMEPGVINKIFTEARIYKQFDGVPYEIRNSMIEYWTNLCNQYLSILIKYDEYNIEAHWYLIYFGGTVMDAYTMARVFRSFDIEQKYIILYVGDFHKGNYDRFLKHMNFTLFQSDKSKEETNYQCLKPMILPFTDI